jgi:hypothetical protein
MLLPVQWSATYSQLVEKVLFWQIMFKNLCSRWTKKPMLLSNCTNTLSKRSQPVEPLLLYRALWTSRRFAILRSWMDSNLAWVSISYPFLIREMFKWVSQTLTTATSLNLMKADDICIIASNGLHISKLKILKISWRLIQRLAYSLWTLMQ